MRDFEIFVAVVDSGSFTSAGLGLGLTTSAVSKQIKQLEDRLGARLLNRTTRKVNPTEEGLVFYERAKRILAEIEEAEIAVSSLTGKPRGTLRMNAPTVFGARHLAPLLPEFLERYPEVNVDLRMTDRFVDVIEDGYDLVLRIAHLTDSSLVARRIAPVRRLMVASPDYIARHGMPETPADLAGHNCLIYTYLRTQDVWLIDRPDGHSESVPVSGSLHCDNAEVLRHAALAGIGIGQLASFIAADDLRAGRLVQVLPEYEQTDLALYAVYPHARHQSPKVRAFVDFLLEKIERNAFLVGDGKPADIRAGG